MKSGDIYLTAFLFTIGFAIYFAKSVATQDQDSWKVIGAKAILNGFTSLMAGAVLMWASVPTLAVIGLASLFGTLGTEAVCKYFKHQINKDIKNIKTNKEEK
ncbi:phage holin family protein [Acinetobacter pecorum]|uniref:Phage holin family protein n=1 Tax=Acinetobacter pecorum TaxID=2762215 RepID=A0ABR8VZQ9_9GAMM|nr:phage holin family protein [Acinetobacter pecorum]MBD8010242.1 phage holin family protein [Acinetobacter pecorum]